MAEFSLAINFNLKHEGGFAETPAGEIVNRGINTGTLQALGYPGTKAELAEIVKNLTVEETEDIYRRFYWTFKRPSIPDALNQVEVQAVAAKILDMCVLSGQRTATKIVQRSVKLPEDGYFGMGTLEHVNEAGDALVTLLVTTWSAALTEIADLYISKAVTPELVKYWTKVKIGWLTRAAWKGV